jgi:D-inositol-3-phosphate glycosyltransferase
VSKETLPTLIPQMADAVAAIIGNRTGDTVDVIHSHYWVSGMAGMLVASALDLPLIHTMHTMARVKNRSLAPGQSAEPGIREDGEQHIVAAATRLIANTTAEAAELERHYNGCERRIDVVSPGVDLKVYKPAFRDRSRHRLGMVAGDFHVVFAGRLQRLKGPHVIVKAAALLRRERPDIPLRVSILGARSGSDKYDIDHFIDIEGVVDRVNVMPPVNAEVLAEWYRSADVVTMPSSTESFGLVAIEAQACGTPVIATNVGGLPRAVSDGRTGLLVDGRAPRLWAEAIASLYDFPQTRTDMGRAASVYAEAFGWEHTALLTMSSYDLALATRRAVPAASYPKSA